ncbi:hypothetical protein QUA56_34925 [Microcoleus sp. N3A4]|uniref:hypothetical protein n=1 Tax=Microcoleus sp. N3A4 TaxID=3055379 RepID=UPI002FCFE5E1
MLSAFRRCWLNPIYKAFESIVQPVLPQINFFMGKQPEFLFHHRNYAETWFFHQNTAETRKMAVLPKMNVLERRRLMSASSQATIGK